MTFVEEFKKGFFGVMFDVITPQFLGFVLGIITLGVILVLCVTLLAVVIAMVL